MPYIKQEDRSRIIFQRSSNSMMIDANQVKTKGELNFALTVLAKDYIKRFGLKYDNINDVVGAFIEAINKVNDVGNLILPASVICSHLIHNKLDLLERFLSLASYFVENNRLKKGYLLDVKGALDGAKCEFQRIVVNPYEDQKIVENGSIDY